MPDSVTMMKEEAGLSVQKGIIFSVEQMWSASRRTASVHSGWATTSAPGCFSFRARIWSRVNSMCTWQAPFHNSIGRPSWRPTQAPRFWSGTNRMGRSSGAWETMLTAFPEVTMTSARAFTPMEQFTYATT